jgi:hypothetical protein
LVSEWDIRDLTRAAAEAFMSRQLQRKVAEDVFGWAPNIVKQAIVERGSVPE